MDFSDFTGLQAAIANAMDRTDLSSEILGFIALTEADMNLVLKENEMETTATVSITNGEGDLPSDCRDIISVKTGDERVLDPLSDREADRYRSTGTVVGFTVSGTKLRTVPAGADPYDVTVRYRQKIPSLSASVASNWVLENFPSAYYYGALSHGELFILNEDRANLMRRLFADQMSAIIEADLSRIVDEPKLTANTVGGIG